MRKDELWFWLMNCDGIGRKKTEYLLKQFHTVENIYQASSEELLKVPKITAKNVNAMTKEKELWKRKYERMKRYGIQFVLREDSVYPDKLRQLEDAPFALYVRGRLPDETKKTIAIIGARDCSAYGREMALWFSKELSKAGMQVVSGLARGVDGYAHGGAIEAKAPTFAVLGSGIDVCYPKKHEWMYDRIKTDGGIISEYGLGVPALAGQFPMRNRLISGLSDGILVIEARERSGSLITADMGLEQGKDIFAIPGRVGDSLSTGCNNLIKMGAYLAETPDDILMNYHVGVLDKPKDWEKNNYMLETKEKIVYANLSYNPKHVNELTIDTRFSLSEVMECLISLELKGYIKQTMKNFYIVCNDEI